MLDVASRTGTNGNRSPGSRSSFDSTANTEHIQKLEKDLIHLEKVLAPRSSALSEDRKRAKDTPLSTNAKTSRC
jgi:hypothetical protein